MGVSAGRKDMTDVAAAWRRVELVLRHSPKTGLQSDPDARARWTGGTQVTCTHANGTSLLTDMPAIIGGAGAGVTPGWLLRAGLASCAATTIAMLAAAEGIELRTLEVDATSRSDARGLFGLTDPEGRQVSPAPFDMRLHVRIAAADGTSPEKLRSLVEKGHCAAPVSRAMQESIQVELRIEIGGA